MKLMLAQLTDVWQGFEGFEQHQWIKQLLLLLLRTMSSVGQMDKQLTPPVARLAQLALASKMQPRNAFTLRIRLMRPRRGRTNTRF